MTDREKENAREKKLKIYYERGGVCEICGKDLRVTESELAHKIPKTKRNLKVFGKEVVHHTLNLALTCPGACNDAVLVGLNSLAKWQLLSEIEEAISAEGLK